MEKTKDAPLLITKHSAAFWRVTLDNPPINMLDPEMHEGLQRLMDLIEVDDQLKVIVFDSANKDYFCAHFDVLRGNEIPMVSGKLGIPQFVDISHRLHHSNVISIALIRGRVRGIGSEFIQACDMRFASKEKAVFGQLEVAMGLMPGGGGAEYLPLLVGYARAMEITSGSDDFSADTAAAYGWINRAFADAELDGYVDTLATRISGYEAAALRANKATLLNRWGGGPTIADIQESLYQFYKLYQRPEAQKLLAKLMEMGFQTESDTEYRLGYYLGKLTE
jgi:enoyl-CoA hydratase/carnithine racemase